ncbi:hypothetical protein FIU28_17390 [Tardiphaga sp. vice154]|uniref:hypothetical protein n=1 Tax=Tardiphaga sp. vice154 TaxID=2592814 RepID=UPI0011629D0E|nr:hypothetical protein [Tardiphaga sp. vice154]QDM22726.1 hypothetical protein FIU28_17390 [Tardiphaga sp. vice154]
MSHPLPKTLSHRLQQVGQALYGDRWQKDLARGLGVSRSSIVLWSQGHRPRADIDVDARLLDLVRRRGLALDQVGPVAELERELKAFVREKA